MYRAGFVGLIGQPNAGKSTLLNYFVDEKVSIVTPKPQTTRRRILGVVSRKESQIVFVDAPGIVQAKKGLNEFLKKEALDVIESSDVLLGVIGLDTQKKEDVIEILNLLKESKKPFAVILTKSDLPDVQRRIPIVKDLVEKIKPGTKVFEFSSKWGSDISTQLELVMDELSEMLPESPEPLYDIELFTPHSVRELSAEIIREKCFELLDKELPYSLAVRISGFEDAKSQKGITKIHAEIIVSRESHLKMIVGKGGELIKKIGMKSRQEIEKLIGGKIFLGLKVIVRENWFDHPQHMKELGYVVAKN